MSGADTADIAEFLEKTGLLRPETPAEYRKKRPRTLTQEIYNKQEPLVNFWRLTCVEDHGFGEGEEFLSKYKEFKEKFEAVLEDEIDKRKYKEVLAMSKEGELLNGSRNAKLYRYFVSMAVVWGVSKVTVWEEVFGRCVTEKKTLEPLWIFEVKRQNQIVKMKDSMLEINRAELRKSKEKLDKSREDLKRAKEELKKREDELEQSLRQLEQDGAELDKGHKQLELDKAALEKSMGGLNLSK